MEVPERQLLHTANGCCLCISLQSALFWACGKGLQFSITVPFSGTGACGSTFAKEQFRLMYSPVEDVGASSDKHTHWLREKCMVHIALTASSESSPSHTSMLLHSGLQILPKTPTPSVSPHCQQNSGQKSQFGLSISRL